MKHVTPLITHAITNLESARNVIKILKEGKKFNNLIFVSSMAFEIIITDLYQTKYDFNHCDDYDGNHGLVIDGYLVYRR